MSTTVAEDHCPYAADRERLAEDTKHTELRQEIMTFLGSRDMVDVVKRLTTYRGVSVLAT